MNPKTMARVAGSLAIILLTGSAALAADTPPERASAASQTSFGSPAPLPVLPALPADYFATTPHLLGEWKDLRTKLSDLGIDVSMGLVDEAVLNLSGGLRNNAQEAGKFSCRPNSTCRRVWG